jgi:hypothetical protein
MDNNNKEVTPREFKVGDIVWDSIRHGKGTIDSSDGSDEYVYPIKVEFNNGSSERYTLDGRHRDDNLLPSLYHQPYKIELIEVPEELPEVGTPVYVWDDGDKSCTIEFFVEKRDKTYITSTRFPIVNDIGSSWDNMSLTLPDKFK